jgi:hypothetical protein
MYMKAQLLAMSPNQLSSIRHLLAPNPTALMIKNHVDNNSVYIEHKKTLIPFNLSYFAERKLRNARRALADAYRRDSTISKESKNKNIGNLIHQIGNLKDNLWSLAHCGKIDKDYFHNTAYDVVRWKNTMYFPDGYERNTTYSNMFSSVYKLEENLVKRAVTLGNIEDYQSHLKRKMEADVLVHRKKSESYIYI